MTADKWDPEAPLCPAGKGWRDREAARRVTSQPIYECPDCGWIHRAKPARSKRGPQNRRRGR